MEKKYNLNGYMITESDTGYKWSSWLYHLQKGLSIISGEAIIDLDYDVLVLTNRKNEIEEIPIKTIDEVNASISQYDKWEKTKYYIKVDSLGKGRLQKIDGSPEPDIMLAGRIVSGISAKYILK